MEAVLSMLPGITTLCLNETDADDAMLKIISTTMPNLEWLEMDDCLHVTDIGLQDVADGCPKLAYLSANECWGILNTDLVEKINAKGGWEDLEGSQASEGYDYADSDDYSFDDSDAYDDYDADDLDHVGF
ncbi:hypothetical protein H4S07_000496 [Coemansia furcata]|uniref:Uncharacterized protein n=1 Tax=Coemansia furcata TaxID=417177 RepID=A0ACC1LR52_9FUNG|nr:hypothetical protein H4S07_000496 [Coemansia furcata]